MPETALVAGVGPTLGETLVREFAARGATVGALARSTDRLTALADEVDDDPESEGSVEPLPADLTDGDAVEGAVEDLRAAAGPVDLFVYNAYFTGTHPGGLAETDPETVAADLDVNVVGLARALSAVRSDLETTTGTAIVTGSPYAHRATGEAVVWETTEPAVRGFTHSVAADLAPEAHVAYAVLDGGIGAVDRDDERAIDATAVAETYWAVATQDRSAWTREIDLRPAAETPRY